MILFCNSYFMISRMNFFFFLIYSIYSIFFLSLYFTLIFILNEIFFTRVNFIFFYETFSFIFFFIFIKFLYFPYHNFSSIRWMPRILFVIILKLFTGNISWLFYLELNCCCCRCLICSKTFNNFHKNFPFTKYQRKKNCFSYFSPLKSTFVLSLRH